MSISRAKGLMLRTKTAAEFNKLVQNIILWFYKYLVTSDLIFIPAVSCTLTAKLY